jgi:hypothetical protein
MEIKDSKLMTLYKSYEKRIALINIKRELSEPNSKEHVLLSLELKIYHIIYLDLQKIIDNAIMVGVIDSKRTCGVQIPLYQ